MIPVVNDGLKSDFVLKVIPTNTYKLNTDSQAINGFVDGFEAMKQAIYLILNTERYEHLIYSWNYGIELQDLIGKDINYVLSELEIRIKEALLQDTRITNVDNFVFEALRNKVHIKFNVVTHYGMIEVEKVVNI